MPIAINYKLCNLGQGCPCMPICPTGAWYWDNKNQRPAVDNSKCNNCGICTKTCPARIIAGALDEAGLRKIKEEFENDSRSQDWLHKERFNVEGDELININSFSFEEKVLIAKGTVIVDVWDSRFGSRCRNSTFTYEEILPMDKKATFYKLDAFQNEDFCKSIGLTAIPSLAIYHEGKLIDYIAGKIGLAEKEQIQERIAKALSI